MRKITIFVFALAFSALGLFAQDELAQYQTWMKAAVAAVVALRPPLTPMTPLAPLPGSGTWPIISLTSRRLEIER
jgi:hypothetical protein